MRRILIPLLALPLLVLVPASDAAAKGELHVKDLAGDANGINSQSVGLPLPATSTAPASIGSADIVSLDVTTRYKTVKGKKVAKGTAIVMTLGGPVQPGVNYGGTAIVSSPCDGTNKKIQVGYQQLAAATLSLVVCQKPGGSGNETIGYSEIDAAKGKITWVLDYGQKRGDTVTSFDLWSSVFVYPVFDEFSPKGSFTYAG